MYYHAWKILMILYLVDCGISEISNGGKIINKIKTVARKTAHTKMTTQSKPNKPLLRVKIQARSKVSETRRHFENKNDSIELIYPRHLDDLLYFVTTPLPYYTVGRVSAEEFEHGAVTSDPCDDIYRDTVLRDLSAVDMSQSEMSKESLEMDKRDDNKKDRIITRTNFDDNMAVYVNNRNV